MQTQIHTLSSQIASLPPGKIICARNGNYYNWFHSDGHTKTYIPKENSNLIADLVYKKFLTAQLSDLQKESRALNLYLNHHSSFDSTEKFFKQVPDAQKFLSKYFSPINEDLFLWANEPFESNPKFPEGLINKSISGHILRSKSEVMIDMLLFTNKIPFRYENPLELDGQIIYPDFTIKHPLSAKTYYWEHFGMMDDPAYAQKACSKLYTYTSNGIYPSINLILTYETSQFPLNADMVEMYIRHYFL